MAKQNQQLVVALFETQGAAKQAAEALKQWDKANDDVKAGAVGVLTADGKGGIKQDLMGPRASGKGATVGAILGLIAAVPTGGLSLLGGVLGGGVGGGIVGAFFHKHLGMDEGERDRLAKEIAGGCAAVGVLAIPEEAEAFAAKLRELGGRPESYEITEEGAAQATAAAAPLAAVPSSQEEADKEKTVMAAADTQAVEVTPETQQLVAGVFATQAAYDAAAAKIKTMGPQLQVVNASNLLVIAKDEAGKVAIDVLDVGASSGADLMALAKRAAADLESLGGNAPTSATDLAAHASHLGAALNPGAVAVGVFVDKQFAPKIEDALRKMGVQVLTADDLKRIGAGIGAAVGTNDLAAKAAMQAQAAPPPPAVFDWHAEYAYSLALQAFIYGFPYVYNAVTRYKWTNVPQDIKHVAYAPVNQFWHAAEVTDASWKEGGCPNNDTAYSLAWVDLSQGPVIITVPDIPADRYWTMELVDFASDNFAYIGKRQGTKAGHYALIGPGWEGKLPEGVQRIAPDSPTPWILIAGRTVVNGVEDLPNVHAIQAGYQLTPLRYWGVPQEKIPTTRDVYKPPVAALGADDPLGAWKTLNAMLAENPPPAHHAILLKQFADIGVGPGLDVEQQPEVVKQALQRAAAKGMLLLRQQFMSGVWVQRLVNGWRYPPVDEGRLGDKFLMRSADQSLVGICANDPVEAVYLVNLTDHEGAPLSGARKYEFTFPKGNTPPVDAFWSLTVYGADYNLVPNPINRYSIGDRTPGVKTNADGSVTFYFQNESPGADKESNWLPTGNEGWFPILRMYMPRPEVVNATWECPAIKRVD
jgi:uncharacterized membrane protein